MMERISMIACKRMECGLILISQMPDTFLNEYIMSEKLYIYKYKQGWLEKTPIFLYNENTSL